MGLRCVAALVAGLALCGLAHALSPHLTVSQLYHTQWTPREGAPSDIESLAQTKDGYLWMGTPSGLFRFDGVRFERVESVGGQKLPRGGIYWLLATPEGDLWVGQGSGGATLIKDGRLTHYAGSEGVPSLLSMAKDGTGNAWAGTVRGLFRLAEGKWVAAGREWNVPDGVVGSIRLDGKGTMWAVVGGAVLFLEKGANRFQDAGISLPVTSAEASTTLLFDSPDGIAWIFYMENRDEFVLHAPGDGRRIVVRMSKATSHGAYALIDRAGHLWFSAPGRMRRSLMGGGSNRETRWEEERLGKAVGLTGPTTYAMIEDMEGNIWVGTTGGLDRFRSPALARLEGPDGRSASGEQGREFLKIFYDPMAEHMTVPPVKDAAAVFTAFHRDPHGELWAATTGAANILWHRRGGRWHPSQRPPDVRIAPSEGVIQAMAMDHAGAMWVSIVQEGVYRVVGDTWTPFGGYGDLPRQSASVIWADDRKRVWFGYMNNRLALLENNRLTVFSSEHGLDVGAVLAIAVRKDDVWIGGEGGLAWFDGQRFHSVHRAGRKSLPGISGIVEMPDGDLWLGSQEGAMRIQASDIGTLRKDAGHLVTPTVLGHLDGMPGAPYGIRPVPTAVSGSDGRVWFVSTSGVVWLDPKLQKRNTLVPTVLVRGVDADGTHHDASLPGGPLKLQPRMRNLQISYTALSLTMPERVLFKYRLEGHESAWQEAGTRREAFYNDLAPGHYRFRVIASNNDGVWNENGAAVELIIPPTFVQTGWFTALWVAAALGLMLLIFAWWLRQAQAQLRSRLNERLVERERIARDLHDTFLQAVQGLMLRFQTAAERIPPQEPARAFMEDALDRADRVLADGRDTIMNLRSSSEPDRDLAQDLRHAGEELARDSVVAFELSVAGMPRALHPIVSEEAYRIGAEALANGFQHARAPRIAARIEYGRRGLVMKITDDGCGFDTSLDRESRGHWGLTGMRERAARIRGRLEVSSRKGEGSRIELTVPSDIAYADAKSGGTWHHGIL